VGLDRDPLSVPARSLAVCVPAAFLGLFFAYPLVSIVQRGLTQDGALAFPWDVIWSSGTGQIAWFTVWQAAVSTALTLAAGLPIAWATARLRFRGRELVRALVVVPFVLPTVVVATAFIALLPSDLERGVVPILLAHVFFNVAVVVRVVGGFWGRLDTRLWDAAATLGASPARRFRELTLPALRPALAAAGALTFLFCFTSFGIVVILGGPSRLTLEAAIYDEAARTFDLRAAAALSLLQLLAVAVIVSVASRLEARAGLVAPVGVESRAARRPRRREWLALLAVLGGGAALLGAPLAALVAQSLDTPGGLGLDFYRALGRDTPSLLVTPWHAILNSLGFAAAATVIAMIVGGLAAVAIARRPAGWLDVGVMLPLGASAVMLGYGFVIGFDTSPVDFRGTIWIVPVVQSLVAAPFVVRVLVPALRAVDPRLREAAAVLGATPTRTRLAVDLPLALRPLGLAAGLAFAIALGEFGATLFLARSDRPTLPVAIFRFLARPGAENQGTAAALCVTLMAVTGLAVLVTERLSARRESL
jgi:thiamine transport system permease protein